MAGINNDNDRGNFGKEARKFLRTNDVAGTRKQARDMSKSEQQQAEFSKQAASTTPRPHGQHSPQGSSPSRPSPNAHPGKVAPRGMMFADAVDVDLISGNGTSDVPGHMGRLGERERADRNPPVKSTPPHSYVNPYKERTHKDADPDLISDAEYKSTLTPGSKGDRPPYLEEVPEPGKKEVVKPKGSLGNFAGTARSRARAKSKDDTGDARLRHPEGPTGPTEQTRKGQVIAHHDEAGADVETYGSSSQPTYAPKKTEHQTVKTRSGKIVPYADYAKMTRQQHEELNQPAPKK